ncbi:MFS transporter [Advenella sp. WQ 585]|uniref:MFS transporter n=1 Tax=Advenella mandrilli TaxID=2800330 RepID=A0ABS1EFM5_9BURK|nr:MFS transporter [Advenella mandrilli]MBK1781949.1 MFS transporter [Advenella mandrilli]
MVVWQKLKVHFGSFFLLSLMTMPTTWRPFAWVGAALCAGTMGTALASPLYPFYQALWDLQPSEITYIFIAYMMGVLVTLLFLGKVTAHYGFLPVLKGGMVFSIIGLGISALAISPFLLGLGRVTIGIASGMISTSAILGMSQVLPTSHKSRAGQIASMVSVAGFGLGPFISGWIAQFLPYPLVTPYLTVLVPSIVILYGLRSVRQEIQSKPGRPSFLPKLEMPAEPGSRPLFLIISMTAFAAFGIFSLYGSLAPSFLEEMIPWSGPAVSGTAIASVLFISGCTQFVLRSLPLHQTLYLGMLFLLLTCLALGLTISTHSILLFVVSDILAGLAHGATLLATFGIVGQLSTPENRGPLFSTYLFIGYLGTIMPIVSVGLLADAFGLLSAVIIFCISMGLLALGLIAFKFRQDRAVPK